MPASIWMKKSGGVLNSNAPRLPSGAAASLKLPVAVSMAPPLSVP